MTIAPTNNAPSTNPVYGTTGTNRVPKQTLGQEDFLKLITVQLSKQDPLKPMEDTSFMAQMAQFSALEQSSQMAKDMASLRSDFSFQSAAGLIGRDVTVAGDNGDFTGRVDSVDASGGAVKLNLGGSLYSLAQVVRVAPAALVSQPQS
jgi:flagellar basal-body rod modification protein FlgD